MKVVKMAGRKAELIDVPDPKIKREYVLVKNHVAPMCTEYHAFKNGQESSSLGHEAAGEVVEIAQPGRFQVGDRVVAMPLYGCGVCRLCLAGDYIHCEQGVDPLTICDSPSGIATYAQYLIKPDRLLIPIPDGMSYEHASMACCGMGPTFGAMQKMNVTAFDTVLITGMGPVGIGGVLNARYRGARVIAVEGHPYRAALAKSLGAEAVIDPQDERALDQIRELTGGNGADKAVETSGTPASKPFLIKSVRRRGEVAFIGWSGQVDASEIIAKGLVVHGIWHWNLADAALVMQAIHGSADLLKKSITHTFPMSKIQEVFELQITGNCGKVLLHPWE